MLGLFVDCGEVHVELEVHVAELACDVEDADDFCFVVLVEGCGGCEVA